jgi:hypothetical protein
MMRYPVASTIVVRSSNETVGTMNRTRFAYKPTIEDRTTWRRWAIAVSALYGAIACVLLGLATVGTSGVTEPRSDQVAASSAKPSKDMARLNAAVSAVQP